MQEDHNSHSLGLRALLLILYDSQLFVTFTNNILLRRQLQDRFYGILSAPARAMDTLLRLFDSLSGMACERFIRSRKPQLGPG